MNYRIREASPADAAALARLHVATFRQTHWGGPSIDVREAQWSQILSQGEPLDFTFVLQSENGELVGFARGTPHDGNIPGYEGRLNKLYILKAHQGRGLGRRLVGAVADRFLALGIGSMLLFGEKRSKANGFHERLGGVRLLVEKGRFHGGYGWPELESLLRSLDLGG